MNVFGFDMNQNAHAVMAWDQAMDIDRPARVIELGSYNGGFAIALAFASHTKGIAIWSFDTMEAPKEEWRHLAKYFSVAFVRGNVFETETFIGGIIGMTGQTFLLCDNGNKPKEFNTFAPYLKPGDVIAAHDFHTPDWYCSEITLHDVATTVEKLNLKRFMETEMNRGGWLAFKRV